MDLYNTMVEVFCSGACHPNPGTGCWAALLRCKGVEKQITGVQENTTNMRMDIVAAIEALDALKYPCLVKLHSSSQYLVGGMSKENRESRKASMTKMPNVDLWRDLDRASSRHVVEWLWVKSKSCDGVERAKRLGENQVLAYARTAAAQSMRVLEHH